MSILSQHDDFHHVTMEAACLPINQKNKSTKYLSIAARYRYSTSQHDGFSYKSELNLHIAARWLHRTAMTLLRPITKTINRASHSLLNSFRNSRTLSTIRRGSEELYWA
ncbi:hypothetical protein QL285_002849 [Trifolium repens]|nr:hypothetical protein QL285_002849 [Trifolium repens]